MENYQIKEIVDSDEKRYKSHPNLEVIVYGNEEVMVSKFNLLDYYNIDKKGYLLDRFKNKYPISINDNLMYIYNFKTRDFTDTDYYEMGINSVRYNYLDGQI